MGHQYRYEYTKTCTCHEKQHMPSSFFVLLRFKVVCWKLCMKVCRLQPKKMNKRRHWMECLLPFQLHCLIFWQLLLNNQWITFHSTFVQHAHRFGRCSKETSVLINSMFFCNYRKWWALSISVWFILIYKHTIAGNQSNYHFSDYEGGNSFFKHCYHKLLKCRLTTPHG